MRKGILFLIMIWAAICSQMSGNAFVSHYLSPEEISDIREVDVEAKKEQIEVAPKSIKMAVVGS
ncbi:hypothetical protein PoMZ_09826 [Pyricularia oryzae]|uniref:Uncharacterized protein n=1 Tax=Pyricularia oryzae TaxID=318829 RepID=A0A4P7MW13_PYROR|nr:hypothetical protein PoMZ_09826 [Pyricularia oryzae]